MAKCAFSAMCTLLCLSAMLFSTAEAARALPQRRFLASTGPCTAAIININVYTPADFAKRTAFPNTTSVRLVLQRDLTLTTGLLFDARYSCTILTSASNAPLGHTITGRFKNVQLIRAWGLSNLLILNVNLVMAPPPSTAGLTFTCGVVPAIAGQTNSKYEGGAQACAALSVWWSWNVQYVKSRVSGRVDVFASSSVYLDSLSITSSANNKACVMVGSVGDPAHVKMANVFITNSVLNANKAQIGVVMDWKAVGVTVANNKIRAFMEYGISCGTGIRSSYQCMLNKFVNNWIERDLTIALTGTLNSGIYLNSHWSGAGNFISCNYIVNTQRCLWLDLASSGTVVYGGACVNNSWALSTNSGHFNLLTNLVLVNPHYVGGMNNQYWLDLRCGTDQGTAWAPEMATQAANPALKSMFPWLVRDFCQHQTYKGIRCNTPSVTGQTHFTAQQTGNCSGIPLGNVVHFAAIRNAYPADYLMYENSAQTPTMLKMNTVQGMDFPQKTNPDLSAMKFTDAAAGDFSLRADSPVRAKWPTFKSCPIGAVGPKPAAADMVYYTRFGTIRPALPTYTLPPMNFAVPTITY